MRVEAAVVDAVRRLPGYPALFTAAFPGVAEPVSMDTISAALGAFQRRLMTPGAPFDRFIDGDRAALSAQQLRGLDVFLREGCASCHAGPLLGGQDIHLMDALNALDEDRVTLETINARSPGVLHPVDSNGLIYVVMPMSIGR